MIPDPARQRDLVGYGRTPPSFSWPDGANVVVNLVLVYEEGSEASVLWGDDRNEGWGEYADAGVQPPRRDPGTEAHYEYGSRAGVWRLARILDEAAVPVTVSAAAVALELNPEVPAWMQEQGHDLLGHGWRWIPLWDMPRDEEQEHLKRAIASYEQTLGYRPIGWNCPSWPSESTRELLVEEGGFLYDSDAYNDELPYWVQVGEAAHLVVPYSLSTNDLKFGVGGFFTADHFFTFLKDCFDLLYREGKTHPKMMSVGLHMRLVGHPSRAAGLERFLDYVATQPEVWICQRIDIARHWAEHHPCSS